jgi:nucleoside-diphosphate-sugar epimerase
LASKFLSYHATSDWYKANNPQFDIIRLLPTFVIGENELVSQKKDMMSGSNARVVGPISGIETTIPLPGTSVHLHDVARAHVRALNPKVEGNQDFILACNSPDGVVFDDALEIAKKHFPDAIASGVIPLGGTNPTVNFPIDASKAEKVLGLNFLSYEEQVKSVLTQWVELSATA